jgi:[protein-PII] uridylyltransferase
VVAVSSSSDPVLEWQAPLLERTSHVDNLVFGTARELVAGCEPMPVTVAAVGGYGRRELFPHSDIDLLIVTESEEGLKRIKEPLAAFLRVLWDSGLRVSQSARTVSECCQLNENNIELHVSLLDLRFLDGSPALFQTLQSSLEAFYRKHGRALTRRLAELTRQRHAKFNQTLFHLEPNIKETPGGIRDIHFLHWLNRLTPENGALEEALHEAVAARSFLYPIRTYLHRRTGRDNNLLTFDLQDEAAESMGGGADAAEWMRRYFLFARQTWQASRRALELTESLDTSLLRQFRDRRSRLSTTDYTVSHGRIFLRNPGEIAQNIEAVFRLFTFSARHGIPLSWDSQRRLRKDADAIAARFAEAPPRWSEWSELLRQPHTSLALHEMQETSVLSTVLPEWNSIDSLVVRDFYHRYTVDEHTLVAIGIIDDLAATPGRSAGRFQKLFGEIEDTAVLRFAILLHDIGKGTDPGEHVRGSLQTTTAIMDRFGMPAQSRELVSFLIEHHLDLPQIMNGRDLDDPATARILASQTRTLEQLRYLALLTYADISAVNPTAMTPWRLEQLWRAFTVGEEQLTRELDTDRIRGIEDLPEGYRTPEVVRFLQGLPTRYLRTHSADEIKHHAEIQRLLRDRGVSVEIIPAKGAFQATVLALDKPGLFAAICGALASFGMNIVKAEAFNNISGLVVDQFRFSDPLRTLELNPTEVDRLRRTVERVVLGTEDVRMLLRRRRANARPTRVAQIAAAVRFNNEASETATLVDFVGEDRPGLLYDLASVFANAGCNIEIVLIDTEAHKAIDVFYVTCAGEKLAEALQEQLRADLIRATEGAI